MMATQATQSRPTVRLALIASTIVLLVILLLLPLVVVFTEALSHGLAAAMDALADPDAISAAWLRHGASAASVSRDAA